MNKNWVFYVNIYVLICDCYFELIVFLIILLGTQHQWVVWLKAYKNNFYFNQTVSGNTLSQLIRICEDQSMDVSRTSASKYQISTRATQSFKDGWHWESWWADSPDNITLMVKSLSETEVVAVSQIATPLELVVSVGSQT